MDAIWNRYIAPSAVVMLVWLTGCPNEPQVQREAAPSALHADPPPAAPQPAETPAAPSGKAQPAPSEPTPAAAAPSGKAPSTDHPAAAAKPPAKPKVRTIHPQPGQSECTEMYGTCTEPPDRLCTTTAFVLGCGESGLRPNSNEWLKCVCP